MSYDPVKDFAPITQVATIVIVLAAHPSVAANSVGELVALAKARPGALHFASAGNNAGIPYLCGALLRDKAGIDVVHVPYKANAQAQQDLLGGQIQFMYDTLAATLPHARSGRLKVLAVVGGQRSLVLPQVPTLTQAGQQRRDIARAHSRQPYHDGRRGAGGSRRGREEAGAAPFRPGR